LDVTKPETKGMHTIVGRYLAAALSNLDKSSHLKIVGVELSTKEAAEIFNKCTDKTWPTVCMGIIEDLTKLIPELKKNGKLQMLCN